MFSVGFWELCLLGLVGLLVIGPEKLPTVARISGFWVGKTARVVASVKADIQQELQAEEMRQIIKEQTIKQELHHLITESSEVAEQLTASVKPLLDESTKQTDEEK